MTDVDLGNGSKLVLDVDKLDQLKDAPGIKAALRARAQAAAKLANELAITAPPKDETPLYRVLTRHGDVGVAPGDYRGVVDDAYHSTLLKVVAQAGTK